jgi:hypothetical protein
MKAAFVYCSNYCLFEEVVEMNVDWGVLRFDMGFRLLPRVWEWLCAFVRSLIMYVAVLGCL